MISILLVDDQSLIHQGLRALLALETDIKIIEEAENSQAGIHLVREL